MEGGRKGEMEGGRKGERDGGSEGGRDREREGGREGEWEGGKEDWSLFHFETETAIHDSQKTNQQMRSHLTELSFLRHQWEPTRIYTLIKLGQVHRRGKYIQDENNTVLLIYTKNTAFMSRTSKRGNGVNFHHWRARNRPLSNWG